MAETTTEWRLVALRPAWQDGGSGQRHLTVAKRDAKKAAKALRDWRRDMTERYEPSGVAVWPAHIEAREVGPWRKVSEADLPTEEDNHG